MNLSSVPCCIHAELIYTDLHVYIGNSLLWSSLPESVVCQTLPSSLSFKDFQPGRLVLLISKLWAWTIVVSIIYHKCAYCHLGCSTIATWPARVDQSQRNGWSTMLHTGAVWSVVLVNEIVEQGQRWIKPLYDWLSEKLFQDISYYISTWHALLIHTKVYSIGDCLPINKDWSPMHMHI